MFDESFKLSQTNDLIGGPPDPEHDSPTNIISVFVNKVIDPEHPFATNVSNYFSSITIISTHLRISKWCH